MKLQLNHMTRAEALNELDARTADGNPHKAARGFSVTADGCFLFWKDELEQHGESHWTVKREPDKSEWPGSRDGVKFYEALQAAYSNGAPVRVALNGILRRKANRDRVAGGAFPMLWTDGTPAFGEITHLDMNDFSVEIRFALPATSQLPELGVIEDTFKLEVAKSLSQSQADRLARLREASPTPSTMQVVATIHVRNPDVVAEVLFNANGRCGSCGSHAPFNRKSNGQPYLEVHHSVPLAAQGQDTVGNASALCPNCHRRAHYG